MHRSKVNNILILILVFYIGFAMGQNKKPFDFNHDNAWSIADAKTVVSYLSGR